MFLSVQVWLEESLYYWVKETKEKEQVRGVCKSAVVRGHWQPAGQMKPQ